MNTHPTWSSLLRWVEIGAWTMGVLLLAIYGAVRWQYAQAREESVAVFEAARASVSQSPSAAPAVLAFTQPVDMTTWSPERIRRYRESLQDSLAPEAVLRMPSLKLAVPVFDGTSEHNLNRGAGRIEGTAHIGEPGNLGIAAHRDGFFRVLKDARIGDELLLERVDGTDAYRVVSITIVDPSEVSVLQPTSTHVVTLVTCYPFYFVGSAPQRMIVRAERVEQQKAPADGSPAGAGSRLASGGGV